MSYIKNPEALIFDIDGTLFQTESVLDTAFYKTFAELQRKVLYYKTPPIEKLYACLGMLLEDIWKIVLPDAAKTVHDAANEMILKFELEELRKGNGKFYPTVLETLTYLYEKGYRLFVASNGLEEYVKGVVHYCGLEDMIEQVYSADEYQTASKAELVRLILRSQQLKDAWMVGDRSSDVEAGKKNGLFTVGCDYADFNSSGELDGADFIINEMRDLIAVLEKAQTSDHE